MFAYFIKRILKPLTIFVSVVNLAQRFEMKDTLFLSVCTNEKHRTVCPGGAKLEDRPFSSLLTLKLVTVRVRRL